MRLSDLDLDLDFLVEGCLKFGMACAPRAASELSSGAATSSVASVETAGSGRCWSSSTGIVPMSGGADSDLTVGERELITSRSMISRLLMEACCSSTISVSLSIFDCSFCSASGRVMCHGFMGSVVRCRLCLGDCLLVCLLASSGVGQDWLSISGVGVLPVSVTARSSVSCPSTWD